MVKAKTKRAKKERVLRYMPAQPSSVEALLGVDARLRLTVDGKTNEYWVTWEAEDRAELVKVGGGGERYTVDVGRGTCTCPAGFRKACKHRDALKMVCQVYRQGEQK